MQASCSRRLIRYCWAAHWRYRLLADAKKLAAKGAEMVQADTTDADQLRAAFEGAYGVFVVTTGLEVFQMNKELELGAVHSSLALVMKHKTVFSFLNRSTCTHQHTACRCRGSV